MKFKCLVEYDYPVEHKPPVSADIYLHGDKVTAKTIVPYSAVKHPLEQSDKEIREPMKEEVSLQFYEYGVSKVASGEVDSFIVTEVPPACFMSLFMPNPIWEIENGKELCWNFYFTYDDVEMKASGSGIYGYIKVTRKE